MPSNIPGAREELLYIAANLERGRLTSKGAADAIREAVEKNLFRDSVTRRAPSRAVTLTPERVDEIRAFTRKSPDMTYQEIGETFGVSSGRVSEIMRGLR